MIKKKTSEAQLRAQRIWDENNKDIKRRNSKKSSAKNFILKVANAEELELVEGWIAEAKNNLKK